MEVMHTSPHPQPHRRAIFAALLEVAKIDLIIVPAGFVVAIIFWIVGLGSQLPYSAIPEWAFALWATISGFSVSTLGFEFSLAPSLATLGLWFLVAAAAKRLVDPTADDADEAAADADDDGAGRWWALIAVGLGTFAVAYAGPLVALAVIVGHATVTPFGFLRFFLFVLTAVAAGFLHVRGIGDIPGLRRLDDETWSVGVRLARRLLWGGLALAVLVLAVGFAFRWGDVVESLQVYSAPTAAGIGLLIVQILFAPGLLFSAVAWSAGTGIGVGGGEVSSAFRATSSPVPDVPVLQLLAGDYPVWTMAAPALLVLLGLLCAILGRERATELLASSWSGLGVAVGLILVGSAVLGFFSRGALGPLGLAGFGPTPVSALAITVWIGVGLAIGLLLIRLFRVQLDPHASEDTDADEEWEQLDDGPAR